MLRQGRARTDCMRIEFIYNSGFEIVHLDFGVFTQMKIISNQHTLNNIVF